MLYIPRSSSKERRTRRSLQTRSCQSRVSRSCRRTTPSPSLQLALPLEPRRCLQAGLQSYVCCALPDKRAWQETRGKSAWREVCLIAAADRLPVQFQACVCRTLTGSCPTRPRRLPPCSSSRRQMHVQRWGSAAWLLSSSCVLAWHYKLPCGRRGGSPGMTTRLSRIQ